MSAKPSAVPTVPMLECGSRCASGISSSTTTYIIAPAEKASMNGSACSSAEVSISISAAPTGSTAPDKKP